MFGNNDPPFADSEAAAGFFADGASWEAIRQTYAAAQEQQENEDDEDDDDEDDEEEDESEEEDDDEEDDDEAPTGEAAGREVDELEDPRPEGEAAGGGAAALDEAPGASGISGDRPASTRARAEATPAAIPALSLLHIRRRRRLL